MIPDIVFKWYLVVCDTWGDIFNEGGNKVEQLYFLPLSKEGKFLMQISNTTLLYIGTFTHINV